MLQSTVCYLEKDGKTLMLHRVKKENDTNHDKWIGVGGKLEPGEEPDACVLREVREETGLTLTDYRQRGVVFFDNTEYEEETIYLYSATAWTGTLRKDCDEGELQWVETKKLSSLSLWEGDKIFLRLMEAGADPFRLTLHYRGDKLKGAVLNGEKII